MKPLMIIIFAVGTVMAFGVPGVPDVPDATIPDFEIPGMELLDDIQLKLDGFILQADTLRNIIPDIAVLDEISVKLEELRDTDPEVASLQAEIDSFRDELVSARSEMQAISEDLQAEAGTLQETVDEFRAGLPIQ